MSSAFETQRVTVGTTAVKLLDFAGQRPRTARVTIGVVNGSVLVGDSTVTSTNGLNLPAPTTNQPGIYTLEAEVQDGDELWAVSGSSGVVTVMNH